MAPTYATAPTYAAAPVTYEQPVTYAAAPTYATAPRRPRSLNLFFVLLSVCALPPSSPELIRVDPTVI